jgi:hypothetical protein
MYKLLNKKKTIKRYIKHKSTKTKLLTKNKLYGGYNWSGANITSDSSSMLHNSSQSSQNKGQKWTKRALRWMPKFLIKAAAKMRFISNNNAQKTIAAKDAYKEYRKTGRDFDPNNFTTMQNTGLLNTVDKQKIINTYLPNVKNLDMMHEEFKPPSI